MFNWYFPCIFVSLLLIYFLFFYYYFFIIAYHFAIRSTVSYRYFRLCISVCVVYVRCRCVVCAIIGVADGSSWILAVNVRWISSHECIAYRLSITSRLEQLNLRLVYAVSPRSVYVFSQRSSLFFRSAISVREFLMISSPSFANRFLIGP